MNLEDLSVDFHNAIETMTIAAIRHSVVKNFTVESSLRSSNDEVVAEIRLIFPLPAIPDLPAEPTDHKKPDIKF